MSDFFHPEADEWRKAALRVMLTCPQHLFLILTKRPERIGNNPPQSADWPFPNVWLGASVEDADHLWRVEKLLNTPATKRFLSLEPLLGPIDLRRFIPNRDEDGQCTVCGQWFEDPHELTHECPPAYRQIHWVIVGGESGPGARPMQREWLDSVIWKCRAANVPCFVKQLGAAFSDAKNGIAGRHLKFDGDVIDMVSRRLKSRKGSDISEWPPELRIQEFPL
jgi:protein gp37